MSALITVKNNIDKLLIDKAAGLPTDLNKTKFVQNAMCVLQDVKGIEKMEPMSVARTILKGAFLGLDFLNKECYAIPYGNDLQFQTDYKGKIKLAKKYSIRPIKDIYAKVVREDDIFTISIENNEQVINFQPEPFSDSEIKGAFAVCEYVDGALQVETMSKKEIESVRDNYSKQPKGKAWVNSFGEMCKKVVLGRLCKMIELEFESTGQQVEYQASDFEFEQTKNITPEIKRPQAIEQK